MGNMHTREFLVGAIVGSLLGGVGALLVAPKAGQQLREDICDTYCSLSDKTQDIANKGRSLVKGLHSQSNEWGGKAKSFVDKLKGIISEEEEEDTTKDILIGGLVGAVLGVAAGLLLAPKPGNELRKDLVDTYEDISDKAHDLTDDISKKGKSFVKQANTKANKWLELAKEVVGNISEDVEDKGEDMVDAVKGLFNNKKVNDLVNWAQLGYRAWQGVKSKKRR